MATTLITDVTELETAIKTAVKSAIKEMDEEKEKRNTPERIYTINQLAKSWKKSHKTVKKMVTDGLLRTTANGLISQSAITDYLQRS